MAALSMAFFTPHAPYVGEHKDALLREGKRQEEVDALPAAYFKDRCVVSIPYTPGPRLHACLVSPAWHLQCPQALHCH